MNTELSVLRSELARVTEERNCAREQSNECRVQLDKCYGELARVTAERDARDKDATDWRNAAVNMESLRDKSLNEATALRASVAEQDDRISWLETQREQECQQKEAALKESEVCIRETKETKQRNAELVAALRLALGALEVRGVSIKNAPENSQLARWHALARAESATPAKHPDTDRLDWLEAQADKSMPWIARHSTNGRGYRLHQDPNIPGFGTARAAIDDARKQGGAK